MVVRRRISLDTGRVTLQPADQESGATSTAPEAVRTATTLRTSTAQTRLDARTVTAANEAFLARHLLSQAHPIPEATPEVSPEVAAFARLEAAQERSRELWATLPPDRSLATLGDSASETYAEATAPLLGPGDPDAFARYQEQNRDALDALDNVMGGAESIGSDQVAADHVRIAPYAQQLYQPVLGALAERHPTATFELVAVEQSARHETQIGMTGPLDTPLAIRMTEDGTTRDFFLTPHALLDSRGFEGSVANTLLEDEELLASWYRSGTESGAIPAALDRGDPSATIDELVRTGADSRILDGVLAMPRQDQIRFLEQHASTYSGQSDDTLGGMLREVTHLGAVNEMMGADATELARTGETTSPPEAWVGVTGVDDLRKVDNFVDEHFEEVADLVFTQYEVLRGDEPRELVGADLINEIGTAMHLTPNHIPQNEDDEARLSAGTWSLYGPDYADTIGPVARAISQVGGRNPDVTTMPVIFNSQETGYVELPLFRVRAANGEDRFVDNVGRIYTDFEHWRATNQLPPGQVSFPTDGHLSVGEDGRTAYVTEDTHAVIDTPEEQLASVLDTAALVGGFVVGASGVVMSGGVLLPAAMTAVGAWSAGRSVSRVVDGVQHGQRLTDPAMRADVIAAGADSLTLLSLGLMGAAARAERLFLPIAGDVRALATTANALGQGADAGGDHRARRRPGHQLGSLLAGGAAPRRLTDGVLDRIAAPATGPTLLGRQRASYLAYGDLARRHPSAVSRRLSSGRGAGAIDARAVHRSVRPGTVRRGPGVPGAAGWIRRAGTRRSGRRRPALRRLGAGLRRRDADRQRRARGDRRDDARTGTGRDRARSVHRLRVGAERS